VSPFDPAAATPHWPAGEPGPLLTVPELLEPGPGPSAFTEAEIAALRRMARFAADGLAAPHPDLGRPGEVCPYVRRAIERGLLRLTVARVPPGGEAAARLMLATRDLFLALPPSRGEESRLRAVITLFPTVTPEQAPVAIDGLQARLKDAFVRDGLMIGQFHPGNDEPGLHSARFRPFRTPVPALAMRMMVSSDAPFLTDTDAHAQAYLARFGLAGCERMAATLLERRAALGAARVAELAALIEAARQGLG
jgi:hypothetical protein